MGLLNNDTCNFEQILEVAIINSFIAVYLPSRSNQDERNMPDTAGK